MPQGRGGGGERENMPISTEGLGMPTMGPETRYLTGVSGQVLCLATRKLLYIPSHTQHSTHHNLCYTGCGAHVRMRNSSMAPL